VARANKQHEGPPDGAPYWLPAGAFWEHLPEGVRRAVREVLEPAYQRLVRGAPGELERSAGITLVHLMWLEMCDQARLGEMIADRDSIASIIEEPEEWIARHLHLVAAKNSTAELLLKLSMVREALSRVGVPERPTVPALPVAAPRVEVLPPEEGSWSPTESGIGKS